MSNKKLHRLTLPLLLVFAVYVPPGAAAEGIKQPECGPLVDWARTIDVKERWNPVEGNPRIWLPQALNTDSFLSLFGKPAMEWSLEDVQAARTLLVDCSKAAGKARRNDDRKFLNIANGILYGRLKGAIQQQARAAEMEARKQANLEKQQKKQAERRASQEQERAARIAAREQAARDTLDGMVDELLAAPDSPDLLRLLAALDGLDATDREAFDKAYRETGRIAHPSAQTARSIMTTANKMPAGTMAASVQPRIAPRHASARAAVLADLRRQIDATPATLAGQRSLSAMLNNVKTDLGAALPPDDLASLTAAVIARRQAISGEMVADAKARIDAAPAAAAGVRQIEDIVSTTSGAGITPQDAEALRAHARARQQVLADAALAEAAGDFDRFPATWTGMRELGSFSREIAGAVGGRASQAAREQFGRARDARMSILARGALPEYEQQLAALSVDREGLREAEKRLKGVRGWRGLEKDVQRDYIEATQRRHDAIADAVAKAEAERRKQVIAAGGDPELVGYVFAEPTSGMQIEFRDERRAFMTMFGMKFAGAYEISRDDIILEGPNGNIVFTRDGDVLNGMGLSFRRQD